MGSTATARGSTLSLWGAAWLACSGWYAPLVRPLLLACLFSLAVRLLPASPAASAAPAGSTARLVSIQHVESGRFLEVFEDGWLYASSYSSTKPSTAFELVQPGADLIRSLDATRQFSLSASAERTHVWEMGKSIANRERTIEGGGLGAYIGARAESNSESLPAVAASAEEFVLLH